ncbi:hypothetical protein Psi02_07140 [Planotetraspora silvatica]|uniref:Uncharacterized protein n=1 Tax=Planotetraspora silvatica TaxID=234614 RepID=A0A8J3UGL0_9ACTN|nr:hypothetical protein [Planotetraspora silvatica]GII44290.1 hypothetical protein Psi02_07140 [Planotetraspora silvatica]
MGMQWDEVVYASQIVHDVPNVMFSAPRARGMPLLLAPVGLFTASVFAIRVYLVILAGVLLYAAFMPWLSLFQQGGKNWRYVPALAAGLFATLWMTVLYGDMAYPNLWLAFTLMAGTGLFFRAVSASKATVGAMLCIVAAFAAASLLRPTDSLAAAAPLFLASVVIPAWRRLRPIGAVAAGLAVGWGAWIIEAFISFGGPIARLRGGAEVNEGGLTWSLPRYLDALDGKYLLCRPHNLCDGFELSNSLWWLLLPALVALAIYPARRHGHLTRILVTISCALAVALPYWLLIDYAAPRFLLPAYALLSIPIAFGVVWLLARRRTWARVAMAAIVTSLIVGHVVVQQVPFTRANDGVIEEGRNHTAQAKFLREKYGVHAPCLIVGAGAIQQGYPLRCRSEYATEETLPSKEPLIADAIAHGNDVIVRMRGKEHVPAFMADWRRLKLPNSTYVAYLPKPVSP